MSEQSTAGTAPLTQVKAGSFSLLLPTFVFTTLLSSMLLFLVQPLMARLTLPLLGGSPSVWAVSMCFFQAALLIGYAYAHLLIRFVPLRAGMAIHILLMMVAVQLLPAQVSADTTAAFAGWPESLSLLAVLATSIGLPFAVMSANAPLIQAWFSVSGHKDAAQPYFLYGASNMGSMAALLLYPTVFEPLIGLHDQTQAWAGGFGVLTAALFACAGLIVLQNRSATATAHAAPVVADAAPPITWSRRAYWLTMAFVPSALLMAWTNQITTDIAAAPFLWLPPLAMYLLSFTATFTERPWLSDKTLRIAQLVALPLTFALTQGESSLILMVPFFVLGGVTFFATACICHRQLYVARPAASQLTEFYLLMSLGGVLGGLFVSLVAPALFNDILEYPALLMLALLVRNEVLNNEKVQEQVRNPLRLIATYIVLTVAISMAGELLNRPGITGSHAALTAAAATAVIMLARANASLVMGLFIFLFITEAAAPGDKVLFQNRSFFGVLTVKQVGEHVLMFHGTTIHGAQWSNERTLADGQRPRPLTYYAPRGGMAKSINATQDRLAALGQKGTYGVIGLGAGSLSCYSQPGESWRFYEIDADVISVARDPRLFSFIPTCAPDAPIALGDARLTLKNAPDKSFDLLIVDAFSSDTVPVHLMTTDAMRAYFAKVKDDGVLVMHASNRHLDLLSVLGANVDALNREGMTISVRELVHNPLTADYADMHSAIVVMSRNAASFGRLEDDPEIRDLPRVAGVAPWTDDYANIVGAIFRRHQ